MASEPKPLHREPFRLLFAALGLALALAAGGCSYSLVAGSQLRNEPFDQVVARTALARVIAPDGAVSARVLSQAEVRGVLQEALEAEWPEADIRAYQGALVAVGLWPPDRDLAETFLDVMSQELLGVYVPTRHTLYVVSDSKPPPFWFRAVSAIRQRDFFREAILAHEIVHLLQHQRYPELIELTEIARQNDDVVSAVQAALEGDATRYGLEAMELGPELPSPEAYAEVMQAELETPEGSALADSPAIIRLTLAYPYVRGYRLSYEEGLGLLEDPPASTEQVLHPEKRREPFTAIDLSGLRAALPGECEFVQENGMGELGLSVLFSDLGTSASVDAWQGWNGDRFLVARCGGEDTQAIEAAGFDRGEDTRAGRSAGGGRLEFVWLTEWDSQSDALEFETAYRAIAAAVAERAGHEAPPLVRREMQQVIVATRGLEGLAGKLPEGARRQQVTSFDDFVSWWSSR